MKNFSLLFLLYCFHISCNPETKTAENRLENFTKKVMPGSTFISDSTIVDTDSLNKLPNETPLSAYKSTEFVPTLENTFSQNKNVIYAPTFLFAWQKLKEGLKSNILESSTNSYDFQLVNKSNTYKKSLLETEYTATVEVVNGEIIAKAFFNKTLPFETALDKFYEPIIFNNKKVSAFGMKYYNVDITEMSTILYYENDEKFILKLSPKDNAHEIIFVKGLNEIHTLSEAIEQTNRLIFKGKKESIDSSLSWKYKIVKKDIFAIPIIRFNVSTNYETLVGEKFTTADKQNYFITQAYQRTGFILNETGAIVESEALAAAVKAMRKPDQNSPKIMIFNKPFYIIIKRIDQKNPYFVMKVENPELLTEYKKP